MDEKIREIEQRLTEEKFNRKSQERSSENISQTQNKIIDALKDNIKILNIKME